MNTIDRLFVLVFCISVVCVFSTPLFTFASEQNVQNDIYIEEGDYGRAVVELEAYFVKLAGKKNTNQTQRPESDLFSVGYLLADLYAWRLNKPEKALEILGILDQRTGMKRHGPWPFHKLFAAEIHARLGEKDKALQLLRELLDQLASSSGGEIDRELGPLFEGLEELILYRIDSIVLKESSGKQDLVLPVIQLPNLKGMASNPFFPLWVSQMVSAGDFAPQVEDAEGIIRFIKRSPPSLHAEIMAFLFVLEVYGDSADDEIDQVLKEYLAKFPETFFSILLRSIFINYYEQEDTPEKAEKLVEDIRKIALHRNMKFITTPDPRFATPEKTWETYIQALTAGDLDQAMECHAPGDRGYKNFFTALGPEKVRKLAEDFGPIEQVRQGNGKAEYILTEEIDGKNIAFPVIFIQHNEVWKIDRY